MNDTLIDKLAEVLLYEGFLLYPYRPSVKNHQRWTFGGLYPREFCDAQSSVESPEMRTQCLVLGNGETRVEGTLRFLRLIDRKLGRFREPLRTWPPEEEPPVEPVASLVVGERQFHSWQEAGEQKLTLESRTLAELARAPHQQSFELSGSIGREPIVDDDGQAVGLIERTQHPLAGSIELSATEVAKGCYRLTLRAVNETRLGDAIAQRAGEPLGREEASLHAFAAAHVVIRVHGGELISQIDPPESWRELAAENQNVGVWPVLVGEPPDRSTMLAASIILYDYPQVAPESPATLFDSTEIDEMLSLRIMTLTPDEKQAMRALDPRGRGLLEHVEALSPEGLSRLHGTTRDAPRAPPRVEQLSPGDRVRLAPRKGADLFDLFLDGKTATITSIEEDFEGCFHFAVVIDDDPGRDLGEQLQVGHRFFFRADEIEPLSHLEEIVAGGVKPRTLVACIGNIFLGDDAFGCEVARVLAQRQLGADVRVVDFGIRGLDLVYALLDGFDRVVFVDAAPRGGTPGTLYVIEPDLPNLGTGGPPGALDAHQMDPVRVLKLAAAMGAKLPKLWIVGCEPTPLPEDDLQAGLSPPVERALSGAADLVESLVIA